MADPTYIDDFTRQFALSPRSTALVLVDIQYASGSREHGLGKLLASQGRLADAEYRFDRIDRLVVPNSRRLADAFRAAGARVIYVTYGSRLADFSDAPLHLKQWMQAIDNRVGVQVIHGVRQPPRNAAKSVAQPGSQQVDVGDIQSIVRVEVTQR